MKLSIAYMTSRRECNIHWFRDSLARQVAPGEDIEIIVVDFWHSERRWAKLQGITHVPPKPCVWQGPHRLTKNDYFAPSNARNTAACLARGDYIAYVDDLSVLAPTWLSAVREATTGGYVACGAFRKVKNLQVQVGRVIGYDNHAGGLDSRWGKGSDEKAVDCPSNWLFGCSVAMPIAALEKINGWPEAVCDACGVGQEDCLTGNALAATGHIIKYDQRLFTYESEELHNQEPRMKRENRGEIGTQNAMDWAALRMLQGCKRFDNDFSPFPDLAALRRHVLDGGAFPVPQNPRHCWYDGTPLSEL